MKPPKWSANPYNDRQQVLEEPNNAGLLRAIVPRGMDQCEIFHITDEAVARELVDAGLVFEAYVDRGRTLRPLGYMLTPAGHEALKHRDK